MQSIAEVANSPLAPDISAEVGPTCLLHSVVPKLLTLPRTFGVADADPQGTVPVAHVIPLLAASVASRDVLGDQVWRGIAWTAKRKYLRLSIGIAGTEVAEFLPTGAATFVYDRLKDRARRTKRVSPVEHLTELGATVGQRDTCYVVADEAEWRGVQAWQSIQERFQPFLESAIDGGRIFVRSSETLLPMSGANAMLEGVVFWSELESWVSSFGIETRQATDIERELFEWLVRVVDPTANDLDLSLPSPTVSALQGLKTDELADALHNVVRAASDWQGLLRWRSTWTRDAVLQSGTRGRGGTAKRSAIWDPVKFALLLRDQIHKKYDSVESRTQIRLLNEAFRRHPKLVPFRERWRFESRVPKP